jgi:hypothetical protein
MKTCTKCQETKPESAFGRRNPKGRTPGLQPQCKDCRNADQRARNQRDPEYGVRYRQDNRERRNAVRAARGRVLRQQAIDAYGGRCVCCGENERAFLVFDHVNDDGAVHRKEVNSGLMPWWLARENYPDTIQLLCANCNTAKQYAPGGCPHQRVAS